MEKINLQTYSLGKNMYEDFKGSLKKVAEMGYSGVEFAASNYGNMEPEELKAFLEELGLEPVCAHVGLEDLEKDIPYLAKLGAKRIVCPSAPMGTKQEVLETAKELSRIGKIAAEHGLKLGYHNHTHEFAKVDGDITAEELLIRNTDPEVVFIELDAGWAAAAGVDVLGFIKEHSGRVQMIHVKETDRVVGIDKPFDFKSLPKDENGRPIIPESVKAHFAEMQKIDCPTGKGLLNWAEVEKVANENGCVAYVVEREYDYKGGDIFGCVKEDLEALKAM